MRLHRVLGITAVVMAATACSSSSSPSSSGYGATTTKATTALGTTVAPTTIAPASGASIVVATTKLGKTLTNAKGETLYIFETDGQNATASKCNAGCDSAWPPAIVAGTPDAGTTGLKVATITRADGSKQLTINGWPAYTFGGDAKPGDTNGQKVGDVWYAFGPDGKQIEN